MSLDNGIPRNQQRRYPMAIPETGNVSLAEIAIALGSTIGELLREVLTDALKDKVSSVLSPEKAAKIETLAARVDGLVDEMADIKRRLRMLGV